MKRSGSPGRPTAAFPWVRLCYNASRMAEAQARVTRTGWRGFVRGLSGLILLVLTACTRPAATETATLTLASPTLSATA
ncbi:hypothetical protein, partial [Thermanaerothrix sp.]|uniref:hypothetical protein n=1 Tax=Thermanaerothrix sp. TaxID=2972675 RepID=UPI003C7CAA0C